MGLPKVGVGGSGKRRMEVDNVTVTATSSFLVCFCPGMMEEPWAVAGAHMSGTVWQEIAAEGAVCFLGSGLR